MALTYTNYNWSLPDLGSKYDTRITSIAPALDSGHTTPAKITLGVIFPRPDSETNSYARHRVAYPDSSYFIPVVAIGGSWPYWYDIIEAPSGATISEEMVAFGDKLAPDSGYGVINWTAPASGTYDFVVRVIDQDKNVVTLRWSVTVDATAFMFVSTTGNDSTGDGSIGSPFLTLSKLWDTTQAGSTYQHKIACVRGGSYTLIPASWTTGSLQFYQDKKPAGIVAYDGESVTLDCASVHFPTNSTGQDDLFIGELTFKNSKTSLSDSDFFVFNSAPDRITFFKNIFENQVNGTLGTSNPSCVYFSNSGIKQYVAFIRNEVKTRCDSLVNAYQVTDCVIEHSNIHDCDQTGNASQWGLAYPKDDCIRWSIRNNDMWDTNTLVDNQRNISVGGQDTNEDIEICYNKLDPSSDSRYAIAVAIGSGTLDGCWIYRNSMKSGVKAVGITTLTTTPVIEDNVIMTDVSPAIPSGYTISGQTANYVLADAIYDSNMDLQGSYRTALLGTDGAEIA